MLKDNLIEVEEHIKKACEKSGRNPEDVCLDDGCAGGACKI